jgi:hypothetical protein
MAEARPSKSARSNLSDGDLALALLPGLPGQAAMSRLATRRRRWIRVPSLPITTSRGPSRRVLWWAPTSSPIPQGSRESHCEGRRGASWCPPRHRRGARATAARSRGRARPRSASDTSASSRDVHGQARWVELGLRDARRARGLAAAPRAATAGTNRGPVAERLHARRQEHGADDRRVHEHGGRQHDAHRLDVEGAQRRDDCGHADLTAAADVTVARIPGDTASSVISQRSRPSRRPHPACSSGADLLGLDASGRTLAMAQAVRHDVPNP